MLTGDDLTQDGSIFTGFPVNAANYYVTFDVEVNGVTKTYAMGYGGIVEEVTRKADGSIVFGGVNTGYNDDVSDEWFNSFSWYYAKVACVSNYHFDDYNYPGNTSMLANGTSQYADYYGNFLSNDQPFASTPNGGYQGGIQSLTVNKDATYSSYPDHRNRIRSNASATDWDVVNYSYNTGSGNPPYTAQYGYVGGFVTFMTGYYYGNSVEQVFNMSQIKRESSSNVDIPTARLNRAPRSLYIDANGNIRLAMKATFTQNGTPGVWHTISPVTAERDTMGTNTINGTRYIRCDPVLVLDGGLWKWVYPYEVGSGMEFPNATKVTNLQFHKDFQTVGLQPAQPSKPMSMIDDYQLDAPEIGKTLMPNNGGDGTYSLALSVMGDSHAYRSNVVADVLIVADLSTSMTEEGANGRTRYDILKDALRSMEETLLGQNTEETTIATLNMLTFGSVAADYGRAWVTNVDDFDDYIDALPAPVYNSNTGHYTLSGATNWEDALERAYTMLQNRRTATANDDLRHTQYLIFLTDGDPTCWMRDSENEMLNGHEWIWDVTKNANYLGTGNTQPLNIWYSLLEARDNAREIVWGLPSGTGISDAYNNTHVDPITGKTEAVATYMYGIATMGNADTLTNLLAYAYNGSFEATYPADTFVMANNEEELSAAFQAITTKIYSDAGFTDVSIYDPITEYTHVASEMDQTEYAFHYYRYRCDRDFNIFDPDDPTALTPRYQAVKNANGVVTHYLDTENDDEIVLNIYERLPEWNREVTVNDFSSGSGQAPAPTSETIQGAEFTMEIYRTSNGSVLSYYDLVADFVSQGGDSNDYEAMSAWMEANVGSSPTQGKPYYYAQILAWDLQTEDSYIDPNGDSTTRFKLEDGYVYAVVLSVWPYQGIYDAIARLNNQQITLNELSAAIDTSYIHYNSETGLYYYDTNLRDEDGSLATVSYQRYDEVLDPESGTYSAVFGDRGTQRFINPDSMPLVETTLSFQKIWLNSIDQSLLEELVEEAIDDKLIELGYGPLAECDVFNLSAEARAALDEVYSAEIVTLFNMMGVGFPTDNANVYRAELEGLYSLYRTGSNDTSHPGYQIDDPNSPLYPQYPGFSGSIPWIMKLSPTWHFYGEEAGETGSYHNGHVVVEDFGLDQNEICVSVGLLLSQANFDPLANPYDLSPMLLTMPNGTTQSYYIIEEGYDYTLREANCDPSFSLNTAVYHPMLVDGVLYDIEVTGYENGNYIAHVKTQGSLSTFEAQNALRPQLTIGKEIVNRSYAPLYERNANGSLKTATSRFRDTNRSVTYNLRSDDEFTVHVEIRIDPEQTPVMDVSRVYYLRYPAYLDQMLAAGTITEDELNAYLAHDLGLMAGTYEIGGVTYGSGTGVKAGGRQSMTAAGSIRVDDLGDISGSVSANGDYTLYTLLTADIPLNANQRIRIYNIPEGSAVRVYETDVPNDYELSLYDWESPSHAHDLYGASAALTAVQTQGLTGTTHAMSSYTVLTDTYQGFEKSVDQLNAAYRATVYNRKLPVDLEIKKIDVMTTARDTLTLTAQTTPAGSGQMYNDSRISGLPGARFALYRQMDTELPVADMAAGGAVWLKPDGTTALGARPSPESVQVTPAKDSGGQPVTTSNGGATDANGKLCFYSLTPGTYYLVETTAPTGYLLGNPAGGTGGFTIRIVITDSGATYAQPNYNAGVTQTALTRAEDSPDQRTVHEILVLNTGSGGELPDTGGSGSRWQTALGLALIFGACALLIKRKARREVN